MIDDRYIQRFDMSRLLKSRDLNIRGIVAGYESLAAEEYFDKLSKLIQMEPEITAGLMQIGNRNADEKIFCHLADFKTLLAEVGEEKVIAALDAILDEKAKANQELTAKCAQNVAVEFAGLCYRLRHANKTQKKSIAETPQDADGSEEEYEKPTLKELLEQADYEEDTRKLRILAVDDASFMLQTVSSILGNEYEVFSLGKGALVSKFLQHTTPELFLLDYTMPEINGFDLIDIIRGFEEHKDTPIIFLTAMGTPYHVATAVSLGACDYVVKPVNADILRQKIANHIVRKRAF